MSLAGKKALVCGGSQGIGAAAAKALRAAGAEVVILSRTPPANGETFLQADLEKIDELIPSLEKQLGTPPAFHILVNNSGGPPPGKILDASVEHFLAAFRQHLLASHLLARWLIPGMRQLQYGRIINVISTSVKEPIDGLGVSNTTRAAVAAWAKTLSRELGPSGITVNNVLPGATRTDRLEQIFTRKSASTGQSREEIEAHMQAEIPLGRFADPSEIGGVIAFLASPAASYLSGASIPVDGGRTRCV